MAIITVARNKKASFDFEFIETFTAGISLLGTEVKSLRDGKMSFGDAFCYIENGELFLKSLHISEYKQGNIHNHEPLRIRKLLMKKKEIEKLQKKTEEKGLTIIPIKIFFNEKGLAKCDLALARGKKSYDKRDSLKEKDAKKQIKNISY